MDIDNVASSACVPPQGMTQNTLVSQFQDALIKVRWNKGTKFVELFTALAYFGLVFGAIEYSVEVKADKNGKQGDFRAGQIKILDEDTFMVVLITVLRRYKYKTADHTKALKAFVKNASDHGFGREGFQKDMGEESSIIGAVLYHASFVLENAPFWDIETNKQRKVREAAAQKFTADVTPSPSPPSAPCSNVVNSEDGFIDQELQDKVRDAEANDTETFQTIIAELMRAEDGASDTGSFEELDFVLNESQIDWGAADFSDHVVDEVDFEMTMNEISNEMLNDSDISITGFSTSDDHDELDAYCKNI